MPDIETTTTNANGKKLEDYLSVKVEKGFLQNIDNGRLKEFLFNPSQFEEAYQVNYARHGSVGLSHKRLQYVGNENAVINLELIFDQIVFAQKKSRGVRNFTGSGQDPNAKNDVDLWRRFLLEISYPRKSQKLHSASPPPVLFSWPGMINMRVRVTNVRFRHLQFQSGTPVTRIMVAAVTLEEEPQRRIYSRDGITYGTIRPWGAGSSPRGR